VALSGSGPTLYGVFADAAAAERARRAFPAPVWTRVAVIPEAR
jgi:4-diphosphocytidyl-2C-methyl-D-erythritol kinase